jgi:hypothetical protein
MPATGPTPESRTGSAAVAATGLGRLASRSRSLDTLLLHDTGLARAEPKTLRYRLLHTAARPHTCGQRRFWLRIDQHWPWARQLAAAFARLAALPVPAG